KGANFPILNTLRNQLRNIFLIEGMEVGMRGRWPVAMNTEMVLDLFIVRGCHDQFTAWPEHEEQFLDKQTRIWNVFHNFGCHNAIQRIFPERQMKNIGDNCFMSRMRMKPERFYGIATGNIHRNDAGFLIGHGFGQPTVSASYVQDRVGVLRNSPDDHLIQSPAL